MIDTASSRQRTTSAIPGGARRRGKRLSFFTMLALLIVPMLIGTCMWIAVSAIQEKIRLSHQLTQIDSIVTTTTQVAAMDHRIVEGSDRDLLDALERLDRIKTTGIINNQKTLTNPWGGIVTARVSADAKVRIETIVSSNACRHLIGVFASNIAATNILKIETSDEHKMWKTIYNKDSHNEIDEDVIVEQCGDYPAMSVALVFPARQQ